MVVILVQSIWQQLISQLACCSSPKFSRCVRNVVWNFMGGAGHERNKGGFKKGTKSLAVSQGWEAVLQRHQLKAQGRNSIFVSECR